MEVTDKDDQMGLGGLAEAFGLYSVGDGHHVRFFSGHNMTTFAL